MKTVNNKSSAYIEEELLSALIDGELANDKVGEVRQAILNSEELSAQVDGLRSISTYFKDSFSVELTKAWGGTRPDLWNRIEQSLEGDITQPSAVSSLIASKLESFRQLLSANFLPVAGTFAAASLLLFWGLRGDVSKFDQLRAIAFNTAESETTEVPVRQLISEISQDPQYSKLRPMTAASAVVRDDLIQRVGFGRTLPDASPVRFVSRSQAARSELPSNLFSEQLIDPDKLSMSSKAASSSQIEWITSDRPFRFIASRDKSKPPVVWIGRNE